MKYLLDTAIFLWSVDAPQKLNPRARDILEDREQEIFLSPVVSWEIIIKVARGKLTLSRSTSEILNLAFSRFGMQPLPVTHAHSLAIGALPPVHDDPFDRMLVAQAKTNGMVLMTADAALEQYPVETLWCGK
jgi:PIN domain nuclease of toxin-antitoxin system